MIVLILIAIVILTVTIMAWCSIWLTVDCLGSKPRHRSALSSGLHPKILGFGGVRFKVYRV